MEVHLGKHHSEKNECGLCDFEAGNLENLETHLNTCEFFQCDWDKDNWKQRFKMWLCMAKWSDHGSAFGETSLWEI